MASSANDVFKELTANIVGDANAFIRDFKDDLVQKTPIRTGRAKSGWQQIDTYKADGQTRTLIVNRVPYIGVLDTGTSKQAPNGIVEPSADAAQRKRR